MHRSHDQNHLSRALAEFVAIRLGKGTGREGVYDVAVEDGVPCPIGHELEN
jgi:hypothetical protein